MQQSMVVNMNDMSSVHVKMVQVKQNHAHKATAVNA